MIFVSKLDKINKILQTNYPNDIIQLILNYITLCNDDLIYIILKYFDDIRTIKFITESISYTGMIPHILLYEPTHYYDDLITGITPYNGPPDVNNFHYTQYENNKELQKLINLESLDLHNGDHVNDYAIKSLTNLKILNLGDESNISDDGIAGLTNLTTLFLKNESSLKYLGLSKDQYWKSPYGYGKITNAGLQNFKNLTSLSLGTNQYINNDGLKCLNNLTSLDLCRNYTITDDGIKSLVNLTHLDIRYNLTITDNGIKSLINLTHLHSNRNITDNGIQTLKNITYLHLPTKLPISECVLNGLTKLTELIRSNDSYSYLYYENMKDPDNKIYGLFN